MGPRLIHRRRDGLLEIRPTRARDLVLTSDTAVLFCMLAGWCLFAVLLVITLLFDPPFLALAAWLVLSLAVEHRRRRVPRLAAVRAGPPPSPAA